MRHRKIKSLIPLRNVLFRCFKESIYSHILIKDFIYLFMRHTEKGRDTGRGRSRYLLGRFYILDTVSFSRDDVAKSGRDSGARPTQRPSKPLSDVGLSCQHLHVSVAHQCSVMLGWGLS